jgi:HAE1 family hydrophobic/amphiphilic exporter-1
MGLSELCIRRPVMTTLVMLAFVIFGGFAYRLLPVAALPKTDSPVIQVSATLPGASPETMAASVATQLERQFTTIAGVESISSVSSLGQTQITLQFDLDREIDGAALDVQAALSVAQRRLPPEMTIPPSFQKVNPAEQPVVLLSLTSKTLPLSSINEFAEILIGQRLSTLNGVAQVQIYGAQKFAVRVQFDPGLLAAKGIAIDDVRAALASANSISPMGVIGGGDRSIALEANLPLADAKLYNDLVIAYRNGAPVRLGEIAKIVNSVENDRIAAWYNRAGSDEQTRSITLGILRQPGANTVAVVDSILALLPVFRAQLPPTVELNLIVDRSQSIRDAVADVQVTLMLTTILVIMVIFLFLRQWRATLIPALALPVSIIGAFAGMYLFGYSINNLTLLALTLSVGFVVDDAIVMLENIVRHVENGMPPFEAALKGSSEIGFTIMSITISLVAVFIPVLFMPGIVGRLFHEFAVTITISILISGFVSLTLTPMLCARFLGDVHNHHENNPVLRVFEAGFNYVYEHYRSSLGLVLRHKRIVIVLTLFTLVASIFMFSIAPKGFFPIEDTGALFANTEGAQDVSFSAMAARQAEVAEIIRKHPAVARFNSIVGGGGGQTSSPNTGRLFIVLKPLSERSQTAQQVIADLRKQIATVPGIRVFMQAQQNLQIGGRQSKSQYQYIVQGLNTTELFAFATSLEKALGQIPGVIDVSTDLQLGSRKAVLNIDRAKAQRLGVPVDRIRSTLFSGYGTRQAATIFTSSNDYQVIVEVDPKYSLDTASLSRLYVRTDQGGLVPLDAVADVVETSGPLSIGHQGQIPAVTLSFNLTVGTALGTVIEAIHQAELDLKIPPSVTTGFQGTAQAFQASVSGTALLIIAALIVIYIVLGILYESFIHPITILSGLPSAGLGAVLTLMLFGMDLDIIAIIGIVMLIGIVKKNAIMMVDVALERRASCDETAEESIYQACLLRFRPIMMTTMAAIMGGIPIAVGLGAGSELRQPLGVSVVGGLVVSQLLTLYITPVVYLYLERLRGSRNVLKTVPAE